MRRSFLLFFVLALLLLLSVAGFIAYNKITLGGEPSMRNSEEFEEKCSGLPEQIEYGKLPDFKSEKDRQNWMTKLDTLGNSIRAKGLLDSYFYPNGQIISYGYDHSGYFVVTFKNCSMVEKQQMNEIYEIIDVEARKLGIENIPVLFRVESFPSVDKKTSKS